MEQIAKTAKQFSHITFKNGNKIPQIGFGTYELKDQDCYNSVLTALKTGYRHIDTASIYKNEEMVGKAIQIFLKENQENIKREDLFITSKISPREQGYEKAQQAVQPGTKNVKLDNIKHKTNRQESWKALVDLKSQKLIKNIGVSNFEQRHLESLFEISDEIPSVNQFELHPLLHNQDTVDFCKLKDIRVEAYSSLARHDPELFKNKTIIEISKKYNKTIAQISLRWSIQKGNIVIPKSKTEKYIIQNLEIFDFEISQDDMTIIDSLNKNLHTCWNPSTIVH